MAEKAEVLAEARHHLEQAYTQDAAGASEQAPVHLIGFLSGRDIPVTSLEILEPNLESVFLHLTEKKLRE